MRSVIWVRMRDRWRRTHFSILYAIPALIVLACVVYSLAALSISRATPNAASGTVAAELHKEAGDFDEFKRVFSFIVLFCLGLASISVPYYSAGYEKNRQLGFPSYGFGLPVSSIILVGCPMLYSFAATTMMYLIMAWAISWVTGHALPAWPMALFLGTLGMGLHMADWSFGGQLRRVLATTLVGGAMAAWLAWQNGWFHEPKTIPAFSFSAGSYAFLLACCAAAFCVTVAAVTRHRRGDTLRLAGPRDLYYLVVSRLPWAVPVNRPRAHALFWFEMKRYGMTVSMFNVCALLTIFLVTIVASLFVPAEKLKLLTVLWFLYLALSPVCLASGASAAASGLYADKGISRASSFSMTRPVTDRTLMAVKFKALMFSLFIAWLPVIPAALLWTAIWGDLDALATMFSQGYKEAQHPLAWLSYYTLLMGGGLWTFAGGMLSLVYGAALFQNLPRQVQRTANTVTIPVLLAYGLTATWDSLNGWVLMPFWEANALALAAFFTLGTAAALLQAVRRGYLSARLVAVAVGIWAVFCAGVLASGHTAGLLHENVRDAFVVLSASLFILPLTPLGTTPLALARVRHG